MELISTNAATAYNKFIKMSFIDFPIYMRIPNFVYLFILLPIFPF